MESDPLRLPFHDGISSIMDLRATLLREIEQYCRRLEVPETTFGIAAVNDGHLVRRLRAGKDIRLNRVERVRAFIRHNPKGLPASQQQVA
jgi:hypothetical protein